MKRILTDLENQHLEFDHLLSGLEPAAWRSRTPFYDWTVYDQAAHVVFFDHEALLAMEDRDRFRTRAGGVMDTLQAGRSLRQYTNRLLGLEDPGNLLDFWRDTRSRLSSKLSRMAPGDQIPWYGPDMGALSFATGRLMETWAHSQDVFDGLKKKRINDDRLYHIAYLGAATFSWSFVIKKLTPPETRPRIELSAPSGAVWEWGDPDADESVRGSAEDFCLVVTQRRNIMDTALQRRGENAEKWLSIAQAFAGVSQDPPPPGSRILKV